VSSALPAVVTRVLLLVGAVLLPSALPSTAGVPRADLVLVVVAATALVRGPTTGLLVGLAGGWLLDLVPPGGQPLGASGLVYAGAGALLGLARRHVRLSPLLPWLVTAAAAALVLGVRGVSAAAGFGRASTTDLWWSWVATAVVGAVLLPLLVVLERRVGSATERHHVVPVGRWWR
jgi:rod shape-determining protein MreD